MAGDLWESALKRRFGVKDTGKGVAFALGYEHSFGPNFYGRVEGGYADLGKVFDINTQRRHFGVAVGTRF